tara:strand:+ start:301 stop:444 length:144 start_codon:yes stop_codon:yes gene_type:complete
MSWLTILACCQYVYEDAIGDAYREKLINIFDSKERATALLKWLPFFD